MTQGIDLLLLFPELVGIGQPQLQDYCDQWLRRPIARNSGVAQITVDNDLLLKINFHASRPVRNGDKVFLPIDELLGYIIDCHFPDPEKRRQLHASVREARQRWAELGRDYEVTIGRRGTLFITCKNPYCRVDLETSHEGIEGQTVTCPPTEVTCPACGAMFICDARDLHFGPSG